MKSFVTIVKTRCHWWFSRSRIHLHPQTIMVLTKWTIQEHKRNRPHAQTLNENTPKQTQSSGNVSQTAADWMFTSFPVDLELNRDFNGEDYEYEDEAKLVIFPDHFEIPLPNIEELPALVSESLLLVLCVFLCMPMGGCTQWSPRHWTATGLNLFSCLG